MKKWLVLSAASVLASVSISVWSADRVGDFSLLDQNGYFHQMSYYDDHKAIALLVEVNGTDATVKAIPEFLKSAKTYADKGIKFFMINPTGTQDRASIKAQIAPFNTDIPVLVDYTQLPSEGMGIAHAGEVVIYDPKAFTVLYRGPVGKTLNAAIDEVLANKPVSKSMVASNGAAVTYPAKMQHTKAAPSYSEEVAPILANNCARCHREGGIAPFAMNSYNMVKGWSPMIREVLMTKRMPPAQIDPHVGKFKEDYNLTPAEQQKIVHWVEAGAKKDGTVDPLAELTWPESKWAYGEPDLIIKVPKQEIPATGVLDYIRVVVPIEGLDRDRYVKASQYLAGDRTVLHHTLNALIPPGTKPSARAFLGGGDPNQARITAYIPGAQPQHEQPNTGGLLKKGSSIALQLHYTTTGKATTDESEIGLWFYDDGDVPTERMSGQCACIFTMGWQNIPANDPDFEMSRTLTIEKDAHIYSFLPHMHFRGKRMRFYAEFPDGRNQELINIAKYNYNWQLDYELEEPIFLPAGTKVTAVGAFDNSSQNPANPDPNRDVPWGQQSWDEMFFGAMTWKYVDQSDAVASQ